MKAVVCSVLGDPEKLSIGDVDSPAVRSGHVKIAVHAASLNYFDILMVQGRYQRKPILPFIPGTDAAGTVIEVASDVKDIKVGDSVLTFDWGGGAFAEEMVVSAENTFVLSDVVEFAGAAALKSVYGTALHALTDRARLRSGDTLLVLGAAGGLGMALLEVGRVLGARVIGAVSSAEKASMLREVGVGDVINYTSESMRDRVRELTGGAGATVVADPVGGVLFDQAVRCISWGGRLCVLGFASGSIPELAVNQVLLKSFDVVGVNYGGWVDRFPEEHRVQTSKLIEWYAERKIEPHVTAKLPLRAAPGAMRQMLDRTVAGKIVFDCSSELLG